MATDEEYKSLQAQLQKQRDINKKLTSQGVDTAANRNVTSNIEQAVKKIAAKLGEYDPEDFSDIAELLAEPAAASDANLVDELQSAIAEADDDTMDSKSDDVMKLVQTGKIADAIALIKGTKATPPNGMGSVDEQVAIALAKRGVVDGGESLVPSDDFDSDDLEKWRKLPMAGRLKGLDKVKAAMLRG